MLRRVVVVAAFEPELLAFREALPEVRAVAVGIGLVDAALGTSALLARGGVDLLVLLGTCGVFHDDDAEAVIVGSGAVLADPAAALGHAALPEPISARVAIAETFGATTALGEIATTVGVTTSDEAARALAQATRARAEHMEAYAVAKACMMHGARCGVILGAANVVGAQGRAQWRANHVAASARAAAFAARALRSS
jgi:nucleoside phosphorylase